MPKELLRIVATRKDIKQPISELEDNAVEKLRAAIEKILKKHFKIQDIFVTFTLGEKKDG